MLLDQVNLNHFRVFECVFRTGSMTTAARELHLTQSGVSQHVKSLEEMIGCRLFDRIKQRLVPTEAARTFYDHCQAGLQKIEDGLLQLKGQGKELRGSVTLGVPIEFGNNLIVPLLSRFSRKHPLVRFRLRMGFASAMNEELLKGAMDFAFVDDFRMDKRVATEKVYDEVLDLFVAEALLKRFGPPKLLSSYFETLDYVEYAEGEPVLRLWFSHHLGEKDGKHIRLRVKATVMDVQGVARFILSEAGAGVLPSYLAHQLASDGAPLYRFKGCGKPLVNRISVASLRDRTQGPAAAALFRFLKDELKPSARATV
jgi:DNA-binding transcriptional LysR family regulator